MPIAAALLLFFAAALHAQHEAQLGRAPTFPRAAAGIQLRRSSPIQLTSGSNWLDTSQRAAVANSYLNVFFPSGSVPTGWVGDVTNGVAGATTQAYRDAVLLRINWFRQMAGVPTPISFSAAYNTEDQQAALMMSANGQLNHMPPSTWTYYTAPGADAAAHSNLCLEYPYLPDPGCVSQYMQDYGTNNQEVGHRRWLLFPQTQNMGTGDVQPPYPQLFANALYVFDTHFYDARPATREAFVAWPPKGFVPYQVVPGRWSFSYPGADFTNATVAMQRNGGAVAVQLESPLTGYGENTLVWEPDNIDGNVSTHWPAPLVDTPITVTVSHVMVGGVSTTFTYTVTVFDPNSGLHISGHITTNGAPFGGVSVSLSGGPTTTSDNAGAYSFGPLDAGTYLLIPTLPGYVFSPSSRSASTTTATADFTAAFCDYSAIGGNLSAAARAGTGSYTYNIAAGCPWTATSNSPWLTVSPSTISGYGPVNVTYSFTTNGNAARTGTIAISGHPVNVTQPSAGQSALAGPLNAGVFLNGYWQLDVNGDGIWGVGDRYFNFLISGVGDKPIVGDWNGDGHAKTGVYRGGFWALDYNGSGGWDGVNVDRFYAFGGNPGEIPIVGDWNGDGRAKIGYYNHGFWALDYNGNGVWDYPLDRFYAFGGNPGEIPVLGDWNGDGRTKIGFYLNGLWVLDYNGNGVFEGPVIDRYTMYTMGAGEKPIVGDWTGDGKSKIGVWKGGFWALNTNGTGTYRTTDQFSAFGGNPGEVPTVGDWNGDGRTKIGYYLNGFWTLDFNGNGRWDGVGAGRDRFIALGGNPGEQPVLGKW